MYCMKCGTPNDDSARFCIKCGTALVQSGTSQPQPPPGAVPPQLQQPPPSERKPRRGLPRWIVVVGILLLALILICGAALVGVYFWLGLHRPNRTAEIVPAGTPLFVSLSPDLRQALHYRNIEDLQALLPMLGAVPGLLETSDEALSGLGAELDIDFRRDLLPWVGAEVSVAMMDTEASEHSELPPLILAVATRSEKRSDAFLEKVWQAMEQEGAEFQEEVYLGIRVVYQVPEYEGAFAPAFATYNDLVVVGTDRDALHQSIDMANAAGSEVLAAQESFEAILSELPANRLGYIYLDRETLLRGFEDETDLPFELAAVQGAAASLVLAADGIRLDYVVSYDLDLLDDAQQDAGRGGTGECETAELVPADTVAYWSGRDPSLVWFVADSLIELSGAYEYYYGLGTTVDERAGAMTEPTGIDLDDDLLDQLAGEWGLAILPDRTGLLGEEELPFGLALFAEIEDPRELEDTLQGLVQHLEAQGALVETAKIEREPCTVLHGRWDDWVFGYCFVDDVLVLGTSESMLEAAIEGWDDPLADEGTFRAVLKELPEKAGNHFFVDLSEASRLVYSVLDPRGQEAFDEAEPYLKSVRAIGMGVVPIDSEGVARGTLFLYSGSGQ